MTLTIDERRTRVRRLAADDLSHRAIAERLGVSKDTVRRDLAVLAQAARATNEPEGGRRRPARANLRSAARRPRVRLTNRRAPDAPSRATPPADNTPSAPTARTSLTVTLTGGVLVDLQLIARCGITDPVEAIRWAVDQAAAQLYAEWHASHAVPRIKREPNGP